MHPVVRSCLNKSGLDLEQSNIQYRQKNKHYTYTTLHIYNITHIQHYTYTTLHIYNIINVNYIIYDCPSTVASFLITVMVTILTHNSIPTLHNNSIPMQCSYILHTSAPMTAI